ncbi:AAA family ATPase [Priestia megaterium]|uniref:AAA family ATPase n=1 Tax=Priestia megaterium TaxID=1404 RepID=UPI00203DE397|nr:AAA family ATPase [Priestia megaterium]MCM3098866.1 AAA family ATPase [Priestia megaterium]
MLFKTVNSFLEVIPTNESVVYLVKDAWNDWWKYENLFVVYLSKNSKIEPIGATKIAKYDIEYKNDSGLVTADLPPKFTSLGKEYVSVGQDVTYYKSLNEISDEVRESVLDSLNDLAFKPDVFEKVRFKHVVRESLLRSVSATSVRGQFKRLAQGRAKLTSYNFQYTIPRPRSLTELEAELYEDAALEIDVEPLSTPPTNLHVVIGRNGVGKTYLLKSLVSCLLEKDTKSNNKYGSLNYEVDEFEEEKDLFANILTISFSGFDNEKFYFLDENTSLIPYYEISLMKCKKNKRVSKNGVDITEESTESDNDERVPKTVADMAEEFKESLTILSKNGRSERWKKAIRILNSDPIFAKLNTESLIAEQNHEKIPLIFKKLSSGHMYVLSIITQLVEKLEERSIIIMDEPETHLHPPLIASLMRVLTELLIYRNAVGIVATHSPVVVQEVPSSCVTIINRNNKFTDLSRPKIQTFGENVGTLTREIFGLEINNSGFNRRLQEEVEKHETYEKVVSSFNNQLGAEARTIVRSLLLSKNKGK